MKVEIYTDGACKGNPGPGGWGALITAGGREKRIKGGEPETTNNRMELRAAIEALALLVKPCEVTLFSDSNCLVTGMNSWLEGWKKKNWKTSAKGCEVKNKDLWLQLEHLNSKHKVTWVWVKGHNDNPGNEVADRLANEGAMQWMKQTT